MSDHKAIARVTLNHVLPWLIPVGILLLWQIAASQQTVSQRLFPPPVEVGRSAWNMLLSGELFFHMKVSLWRSAIGFLLGGGIGFLLGVCNALFITSYLCLTRPSR
jgi:sulfonate transport system permease protein